VQLRNYSPLPFPDRGVTTLGELNLLLEILMSVDCTMFIRVSNKNGIRFNIPLLRNKSFHVI